MCYRLFGDVDQLFVDIHSEIHAIEKKKKHFYIETPLVSAIVYPNYRSMYPNNPTPEKSLFFLWFKVPKGACRLSAVQSRGTLSQKAAGTALTADFIWILNFWKSFVVVFQVAGRVLRIVVHRSVYTARA